MGEQKEKKPIKRICAGLLAHVCADVFYQYETAMRLNESDVAIALSNSGRSTNVVNAMKIAHEQGAFTCCITRGDVLR